MDMLEEKVMSSNNLEVKGLLKDKGLGVKTKCTFQEKS